MAISRTAAEAALAAHREAARPRERSEVLGLLSRAGYLSAAGEAEKRRLLDHVYGEPVDDAMRGCELARDELVLLALSWLTVAGASGKQLDGARVLVGFGRNVPPLPLADAVGSTMLEQMNALPDGWGKATSVGIALACLDRAGLTPRQLERLVEVLTWDEAQQDLEAAP